MTQPWLKLARSTEKLVLRLLLHGELSMISWSLILFINGDRHEFPANYYPFFGGAAAAK